MKTGTKSGIFVPKVWWKVKTGMKMVDSVPKVPAER